MKETRVLTWNFSAIFTEGIRSILARARNFQVDVAANKTTFHALAENADILLVGTEEGLTGEDKLYLIKEGRRKAVFFFDDIDDSAVMALGLGAYGILPMTASPNDFVACMERVRQGKHSFPCGLEERWLRLARSFETASVC